MSGTRARVAEWDGSTSIGGLPARGVSNGLNTSAGRISAKHPKAARRSSEPPPRSAALLKQTAFEPEHDHIFYCHSGVRAATPLFALYLMGFPVERLHLYDGSWIEWSQLSLDEREARVSLTIHNVISVVLQFVIPGLTRNPVDYKTLYKECFFDWIPGRSPE